MELEVFAGLQFGRQVIWRLMCDRVGVVELIGGIELAVAVYSDCKEIGLWLRARTWSSSCLAAGTQLGWCRPVGGTVSAETLRRHVVLTAVEYSRDVATSRCFNCCCEQQSCCGVTLF